MTGSGFTMQRVERAMQKDAQAVCGVFTGLDTVPYFHPQFCLLSLIYPELVVRGPVITEIMRSTTVAAP